MGTQPPPNETSIKHLHTFSYLTRYASLSKAILDTEEFVEDLRKSIDAISNLFIGGH